MAALYVSGLPHELTERFRTYFTGHVAPETWRVTVTPSSPMWACFELTRKYDENLSRAMLLSTLLDVTEWVLRQPEMRRDIRGTVTFKVSITPDTPPEAV